MTVSDLAMASVSCLTKGIRRDKPWAVAKLGKAQRDLGVSTRQSGEGNYRQPGGRPLDLFFFSLFVQGLAAYPVGAGVADRLCRRLRTDHADLLFFLIHGSVLSI